MSDRLHTSRFAASLDAGYLLAAGAEAAIGSYQRVDARVAGRGNTT